MPFGFWVLGNRSSHRQLHPARRAVSNAFRLLGSGERSLGWAMAWPMNIMSQMPFGFWVLGNSSNALMSATPLPSVSNAFRLLGSGELRLSALQSKSTSATVSNAFRLLGSGEPTWNSRKPPQPSAASQMPFGFWVLGNATLLR